MTIFDLHDALTIRPPRFGPMFKVPHHTQKLCQACSNCGWPRLEGFCNRETCR